MLKTTNAAFTVELLLYFVSCSLSAVFKGWWPQNGWFCVYLDELFYRYVNSVPTQTSIHARRVTASSVCDADLTSRWSNSGRWWGFCQIAWLLTRLLLLFKADNHFASVQGGATQCCSEVENKEILKMCNQDCFLDSIRSLETTATFSWRRGLNALTSTFESVWVHRLPVNFRE